MPLPFHQVDAFSDRPFGGNPAIVYRLEQWLPDEQMQRIAAEHNLAETAFLVREADAWQIRWFTPATEVPLCGHATLASAKVLFEVYGEPGDSLAFTCRSGALIVRRLGERLELDFPAQPAAPIEAPKELATLLGLTPRQVLSSQEHLLVIVDSEAQVRACRPNLAELARLPWQGVIVSAPGERHDFVSRYFAPAIGIDEDPVTGAAHCVLIPYWAARLGRSQLSAFQCSTRGGELECRTEGQRVRIAGHATLVARGELYLQ